MNRCLPGRKLFRGLLLYGGKEVVEMLAAAGGKIPPVGVEHGVSAHGEVQVFGVGAEVAVDHGGDHAEEIAALVVYRPAAVAGADGSGDLDRGVIGAGADAGAGREAKSLRMAYDENVFALADLFFGLDGLNEFGAAGFAGKPDQARVAIFVACWSASVR